MVALLLVLGAGVLFWAVWSTRQGWTHINPYYSGPADRLDERHLIQGILLSAAPVLVIAWRTGRIASGPREIWLSGLAGVWLPIVTAVSLASVANSAGWALHWIPSLPRGINWALLGADGKSLVFGRFVGWTLACT